MPNHFTIEVPRILQRHEIGKTIGSRLKELHHSEEWVVEEIQLDPKLLVPTTERVRIGLRKRVASETLRVYAVAQTMRLVIDERAEHLYPLLFVAARDEEGMIGCKIIGDFSDMPIETRMSLVKIRRMFSGRPGTERYRDTFNTIARVTEEVITQTKWFTPELQLFWRTSNQL